MDYRHTYFFINAGLLLLNLLFQPLQSGSIRCSAISLQHLDIPILPHISRHRQGYVSTSTLCTYSSVSGVIFFSGSSSSANSFLYFSQFCPVALGILEGKVLRLFVAYQVVGDCGIPAAQIVRPRLDTRTIFEGCCWVRKSESVGCCRFVGVVRNQ